MVDGRTDTDRSVVVSEARSLALHHAVGERLLQNPALVGPARDRVRRWMADGRLNRVYGEAWLKLLDGPLDDLIRILNDPRENARTLRSCSPFAGVLDPKTRFRIWRQAGQRA